MTSTVAAAAACALASAASANYQGPVYAGVPYRAELGRSPRTGAWSATVSWSAADADLDVVIWPIDDGFLVGPVMTAATIGDRAQRSFCWSGAAGQRYRVIATSVTMRRVSTTVQVDATVP